MKQHHKLRKILRELAWLAAIILLVFGARSSLADHYHVPTGSMEFTLMPGDRVVVDKRAYGLRVPFTRFEISDGAPVARGEIVIFDSPESGVRLIKRIVAVGGDRVALENGHLSINGSEVAVGDAVEALGDRQYRLNLAAGGGPDFEARVPEGYLLAVGDYRGRSNDGRMFGFIPETAVYGQARAVYWRSGRGAVWISL